MAHRWTLESIDWQGFEPDKVTPELLATVKAAAIVEANSADYVTYLHNIFPEDEEFKSAAAVWGEEEAQHGLALGRWAEMADPDFSFEESLRLFREGYSLPLEAQESVRGSRTGELIARCVVESGTSSFYSALRDATAEPVLRGICKHIATDEFFHYRLFKTHLQRYKERDRLSFLERLKIALSRVQEAEDDELAYAYFAANILPRDADAEYDMEACAQAYWRQAMSYYRERHIDNAARMILRAADFNADGRIADFLSKVGWRLVAWRRDRLSRSATKGVEVAPS